MNVRIFFLNFNLKFKFSELKGFQVFGEDPILD